MANKRINGESLKCVENVVNKNLNYKIKASLDTIRAADTPTTLGDLAENKEESSAQTQTRLGKTNTEEKTAITVGWQEWSACSHCWWKEYHATWRICVHASALWCLKKTPIVHLKAIMCLRAEQKVCCLTGKVQNLMVHPKRKPKQSPPTHLRKEVPIKNDCHQVGTLVIRRSGGGVTKIMICRGIQNGRECVLHAKRENIPEGVVNLKGRICISEVYQQGGMSYIP